ncbi:MAG TPA: MmgE/PrpD family protein, partial [Candidatus Dormibacteraeota bacterium]|nr:MmgE/PrpD family protein [Candidatus Dormibacteraeota bacterium]
LAARVEVRVDPRMSPRGTDYPTALVEVRLRDGRALTRSTTVVRGDFADPVPAGEIVEKFVALASDVLGSDRVRAVVEIVDQVDTLKDVRDLTVRLGQ